MANGKVIKVSGPLVVVSGMDKANMFDVVRVGKERLIGEIIEMRGDRASVQVYEETSGIGPGIEVETTGMPLSVELGPGLIETMFDGIQRPLEAMRAIAGNTIRRGIEVYPLDRNIKWTFMPLVQPGTKVTEGDIIGHVQESPVVDHKIMVPQGMSGTVTEIYEGDFTVVETVAKLMRDNGETVDLTMMQKWPVRKGRGYKTKLPPNVPMVTGQRVIDFLFPIAKGGTAAIPGPFGSGKTVVQHQLAKWSDVDIVVYVGCGERGNEMTDVLREFPELRDPRSGESLMKRTVLIANTSDMPVAAREASIYTGITIAEYYRDMGYSVAILADSTSRWAEALREMSGRLEEMPGEEGYPAYLTSRLAQYYERAGSVVCLGSDGRRGTLSAIGAVSPQGGDISDPVAQATLRIVKVFWGLDSALAYRRHFPAINWLNSYSLYTDRLSDWLNSNVDNGYMKAREVVMRILQNEAELNEIVQLVGIDSLSAPDRLTLETARMIREDFIQQNAFSDTDAFSSLEKQYRLVNLILEYYELGAAAIARNVGIKDLFAISSREQIARAKDIPQSEFEQAAEKILSRMRSEIEALKSEEVL